jgi:hypothetical protein
VGVRFPWGNVFALRCGHLYDAAPLDNASGSRRSKLRHRRFRHGCPRCGPGRSRAQKGGGSKGRLALSASGDHASAHHWTDAFSASRMRTTLGPCRSPCCLHRTVSTSDVLVVIRRHARPISSSTDALTVTRSSRMVPPVLTFEPRTPRHPAGKGKMGGSPRTPSVVS